MIFARAKKVSLSIQKEERINNAESDTLSAR